MAGGVKKPLSGMKILVTRAKHQAGEFSLVLRNLGAKPVEFPLIEIISLKSVRLDHFIQRFCSREINFDYVIFTSRNGVDDFFRRAGGKAKGARALRGASVVAIGPKTAQVLRKRGVKVRAVPEKYVAESVADMLGAGKVRGRRVLLMRARGARRVLPQRLRKAGADVTVKCLYEAVPGSGESRRLRKLLREMDFVTVASGSTVRNLVKIAGDGHDMLPEQVRKMMRNTRLASIGPVTSRVARKLGLRVDVQAQEYTMWGLADAIARFVKSEK
jgi:uroporphyrinogen III methyltransferase/synthase